MRTKYRYITIQVKLEEPRLLGSMDESNIIKEIRGMVQRLHGDFGLGLAASRLKIIYWSVSPNTAPNQPMQSKSGLQRYSSAVDKMKKPVFNTTGLLIIRCQRAAEKYIKTALILTRKTSLVDGKNVVNCSITYDILHVSGTIRGCEKFVVSHYRNYDPELAGKSPAEIEELIGFHKDLRHRGVEEDEMELTDDSLMS